MNKKLILIGASGHGKVIADIAKRNGYSQIAFLDDAPTAKVCAGYLKAEYPILKDHKYLLPVYQVVRWGRMLCSGGLKDTVHELKANVVVRDKATISVADILRHLEL